MNEAMLSAAMSQAMQLDAFWTTLASHAAPATQLAVAGTARMARDAVVQCAPKATLTLTVWPPPSPDTLGLLRNSGRTLPATVVINNNTEPPSPLVANHIARLSMHQLRCGAVTSLELGGGTWMVDTALLADICAALPALSKLVLSNVTTPAHLPAGPTHPVLAWPSLRTVSVRPSNFMAGIHPTHSAHLLTALGVRAGGGVISLSLGGRPVHYNGIGLMLNSNPMHALRKLSLPQYRLWDWGADEVGGALIRNAPALEHLKVYDLMWYGADEHYGTSAMCVPWRILEVEKLNVAHCSGLPLGTYPGQPPLILRVMFKLSASLQDRSEAGAHHLVTPSPGKRQVQLECTRAVYITIDSGITLRVLTLSGHLSNLILDGIDSEDDINGLDELSATGITITFDEDHLLHPGGLVGLQDLPRVTKVEFRADDPGSWAGVDGQLLASLPVHVTDVRLIGVPSLEVVSRMCMEVSRLPHRQAQPVRLCVPGVTGWLDAAERAIQAAGIGRTGVVQVPNTEL